MFLNIKAAASSGQFWSKVGNAGKNILSGRGAGLWGILEPLMYSMFPNMDQSKWQQPDENGDFPMARGGMINERVDGIGRTSGKSYTIGEAGSEMVVPMSKMGKMGGGGSTTVNINISNMSGDANDLNKLRSTILEVMQTVNVNRGR